MSTLINITFRGGTGSITARLFRDGKEMSSGTTHRSGDIILADAEKDDAISITGVSPDGGTNISINVRTDPATPQLYESGPVFSEYDVI
jgi:hypothetical protein